MHTMVGGLIIGGIVFLLLGYRWAIVKRAWSDHRVAVATVPKMRAARWTAIRNLVLMVVIAGAAVFAALSAAFATK